MKNIFRKSLVTVVVAIAAMIMSVSASAANKIGYANVNMELKKKASASAKKVVKLVKYDQIQIVSNSTSGWSKVKANHNGKFYNGYVEKKNVTIYKNAVKKNAFVNYKKATLFKKASDSSKTVVVLSKNDKVTIKKTKNKTWFQVCAEHNGTLYNGYLKGIYVALNELKNLQNNGNSNNQNTNQTANNSTYSIGYVNYTYLNLREKASDAADSKIVVKLSMNDKLVMKEHTGVWYKVTATHDGKEYEGYVYEIYVSKTKVENPIENPFSVGDNNNQSEQNITTNNNSNNVEETFGVGYVNYDYLNLRKEALGTSSVVMVLDRNDLLIITDHRNNWCKVEAVHNGRVYKGYVFDQYVQFSYEYTESGSGIKEFIDNFPYYIGGTGFVNYDYLNLRFANSTYSSIVTVLDRNDKIIIRRYLNDWYDVIAIHNGMAYEGCVYKSYVKVER